MPASQDYVEFVHELLAPLGQVSVRRMFGGAGVYSRGVMFGLIADDVLYLKADADSRRDFETYGMGPFVYEGRGKPVAMSYWQVPAEVLDDPDAALAWGRKALEVARQQKAATPPASRRSSAARWRR